MAPFVPFPNGVQVEILYVLDGVVIENRLWFYTDALTPPGSAELKGLADGVADWHTSLLLPYLSSDLQFAVVVATDWSAPGGAFEVSTLTSINGGVAAESLSANVPIVVAFRWDNLHTRLKRNKNYVPGVPEQEVTLNTPSATIQNVLFEAYAALIDAARTFAPGDYWYWVMTSAIADNAPRSEMLFGVAVGPVPRHRIILGQRRKRLPS